MARKDLTFNQQVREEVFFNMAKTPDVDEKDFRGHMQKVLSLIILGTPLLNVRAEIKRFDIDVGLKKRLLKYVNEQAEIITGQEKLLKSGSMGFNGSTLGESVTRQRGAVLQRLLTFAFAGYQIFKSNLSRSEITARVNVLTENTLRLHRESNKRFFVTESKAGREDAYNIRDDESLDDVRGWRSVAVLDGATSAICSQLHNKFYSKKQYKARSEIPNAPPRHPNCRSVIVTVYGDGRKDRAKSIDAFLRNNPKDGMSILGQQKYRLFIENKASVKSFGDIVGKRWYTNKQIKERLSM